jgi:hypothetical protein
LAPLIPLLAQPRDTCAVVIVRDTLLDRLLSCVREADPQVVLLDSRCREVAWSELVALTPVHEGGL